MKKTVKFVFCHNYVKFSPILIIFGNTMAKTIELCKMHYFPFHVIYVNALLCETLLLQFCIMLSCCLQ